VGTRKRKRWAVICSRCGFKFVGGREGEFVQEKEQWYRER
jgi:hypothetical protein